jgi:flagellar hook-associated protein 2
MGTFQASGLVSGLPVNDIIKQLMAIERRPVDLMIRRKTTITEQGSLYDGVKTRVDALLAAVKSMTTTSVLDTNPFDAKKATSSDDSIGKATVGQDAGIQQIRLEVVKKATATKAASTTTAGQWMDGTSTLSTIAQGRVTSGTFTVFVNGTANTVTVDTATQAINDILTQFTGIAGITGASVTNGKIALTYAGGTDVQLGANGDTSNFLDATFLKTGTETATDITASVGITTTDLSAVLTTNASARLNTAVTAGTFKIGTATFTIDGTTTLSGLINQINNNADAGVSASFNTATNKFELSAKTTGSGLITLQDTGSNFLEAMGLISGTDSGSSQTAGQNAQFTLNGATLYSASNEVGAAITGLEDVTLSLLKETPGTTITIDVGRDSQPLKDKITDMVGKFNEVLRNIDELTDPKSGKMKADNNLKRFRSKLRQAITSSVAGLTRYQSLPDIGISTGNAAAGNISTNLTFAFDSTKFDTAMATNFTEVRSLMIGTTGVMTNLQTILDNSVYDDPGDTQDGLFPASLSYRSRQIKSIDNAVAKAEERLTRKEAMLRKQFNAMEQLIAQANAQGNAITNLNNQLAAQAKNN